MTNQDLINEFTEKYNLSFTAKKDLEILIYAVKNNNPGVYVPCFMCSEREKANKKHYSNYYLSIQKKR
jgi:hypothetical protein